jgi:predicted phosphate transport protein (TIGR00153 family)
MFSRFMPHEGNFFELFNQHAEQIQIGTVALRDLITNFDNLEVRTREVVSAEKKGDKITHETIDALHKTFITPLDRDDIHKLISTMDDMLDLAEDVAETISLYDIRVMTPETIQLADICVACSERVKVVVGMLSNMENASAMLKIATEIDRLESDADRVMRAAMAKLFREENDVKTIIKMKALYELLETITDKAEDVANVIQGIVLENA